HHQDHRRGAGPRPVHLARTHQRVRRRPRLRDGGRRGSDLHRLSARGRSCPRGGRMSRGAILVVDDEAELRSSACEWLSLSGVSVVTAQGGAEALAWLDRQSFEAVVSDMRMPGLDGLGLLEAARLKRPLLPIILLTGHGDVALAVEAMRA